MKSTVVTALDVFDKIINKDVFERRDLEFIIDKIIVGNSGEMKIYLRSDIQTIVQEKFRTINVDKAGALTTTMYQFLLGCKSVNERYVGLYKAG